MTCQPTDRRLRPTSLRLDAEAGQGARTFSDGVAAGERRR